MLTNIVKGPILKRFHEIKDVLLSTTYGLKIYL